MGIALSGNQVIRDVTQTRISFINQHIQSPAENEAAARKELKYCLYEGLINSALAKISGIRARHETLETEQRIMSAQLRTADSGAANNIKTRFPSAKILLSKSARVKSESLA